MSMLGPLPRVRHHRPVAHGSGVPRSLRDGRGDALASTSRIGPADGSTGVGSVWRRALLTVVAILGAGLFGGAVANAAPVTVPPPSQLLPPSGGAVPSTSLPSTSLPSTVPQSAAPPSRPTDSERVDRSPAAAWAAVSGGAAALLAGAGGLVISVRRPRRAGDDIPAGADDGSPGTEDGAPAADDVLELAGAAAPDTDVAAPLDPRDPGSLPVLAPGPGRAVRTAPRLPASERKSRR